MLYLSLVLFLLSPIFLVVGLIKPSVFSKLSKKDLTRKQIASFFSILTVVSFMVFIASSGSSNSKDKGNNDVDNQNVVSEDIAVTSQIVKKVEGKCRYFFDIRNNEEVPFEGSVEVNLINELGDDEYRLGREIFETTAPVNPNHGNSVYFDINTCPKSVHGETGITKYKFVVKRDGKVINQGEAPISTKFEDLDF